MGPEPSQPNADTAPEWNTLAEDVYCPLCDYNLRGLPEPRCPECGYRFQWAELLDPARRTHPYLFEHHPKRKLWSFFRTLRGGLRPAVFWQSLHPAQPSKPRRLFAYWVIVSILATVLTSSMLIARGVEMFVANHKARADILARLEPQLKAASPQARAEYYRHLDEHIPLPIHLLFYLQLIEARGRDAQWIVPIVAGVVAWPVLTFLALMIFQQSMRRAKVRTVHVLRCVIYSFDTILWFALLFAPLPFILVFGPDNFPFSSEEFVISLLALATLCLVLIVMVRMILAYQRYLRFSHAAATVIVAKVLVFLVAYTLYRWVDLYLNL